MADNDFEKVVDFGEYKQRAETDKAEQNKTDQFDLSSTHKILATLKNTITALRKSMPGVFRYDEMACGVRCYPKDCPFPLRAGLAEDWHATRTLIHISEQYHFEPSKTFVFDAIDHIAREDPVHPIRDWIKAGVWDGIERIEYWLQDCLGAPDTPYIRAVGRNFLVAAVARVFEPGCKVDTMVVFEGAQGIGKSQALRLLFGEEYHLEVIAKFGSKDFYQSLRNKWGIEFAELSAIRDRDIEEIKQAISSPCDNYRDSFGRLAYDHLRQGVWAATTNSNEYLRDSTGERRFLPVPCGNIALDILAENREQMFFEAYQVYLRTKQWWVVPQDELATMHADRKVLDVWHDRIATYCHGRIMTSVPMVLESLGILPDKWEHRHKMAIARTLVLLGYERKRANPDEYGHRPWIYRKIGEI